MAAASVLTAGLGWTIVNPSLRGKPIAVGGGVVFAASYEARAFGIRGGMPGRRARELCPQLIFVDGHFKDYQRLGGAAINVLNDFTPLVERISIDEAFVSISLRAVGRVPGQPIPRFTQRLTLSVRYEQISAIGAC